MTRWRLIRDDPADPAWNMAVDEALLEAWRPGDPPVLRLYRWDPPALSLGRFQRPGSVAAPPGAVVVRRISGGAAIHHRADEVTYAVVAGYDRFAAGASRGPRAAYAAIHAVLARALADLGVPLDREAPRERPAERARPDGLCYARATDYDLVTGGRKLIGSAQRRRGGRFLQHGSLPLSAHPGGLPGATSLADLLPAPPGPAAVAAAVEAAWETAWGGPLAAPGALRPAERALAERLRAERYGDPAWTAAGRAR